MKSNLSRSFITSTFVVLIMLSAFQAFSANDSTYSIKFIIKKLPENTKCELCYYYGDKQYIKDSARSNSKGEVTFEGKEKLGQGVYLLVFPNKTYFDFLVDETQHFTLETDSARDEYINKMKVKGSNENELFFQYQIFMLKKQKQAEPIRDKYKTVTKDNKDSLKLLEDQLKKIGEEVKAYQKEIITKNPTTFVTKFLKSLEEPVIPDAPILPNGRKDSTFAYRYYKAHYFDNFDLSDDRMLRTPVFNNYVKRYLDNLTVPAPDSLNESCDYLISKTRPNKEMFKYMVWWLTLNYETSKYMGMDAVFVHLSLKYYSTPEVDWVDSTTRAKIVNKALDEQRVLIGKQAPSLNLRDSTGKYVSLYDVKAKYTVVVFWDHGCGHCKKAIPVLATAYDSILKKKGVEVYAIETEDQPGEWKKFIVEHHLNWLNLYEPDEYYRAFAKRSYNVTSTPLIFVLDENKIIKAKKVDPDQISNLVDMFEKEKEAKEKEKKK